MKLMCLMFLPTKFQLQRKIWFLDFSYTGNLSVDLWG